MVLRSFVKDKDLTPILRSERIFLSLKRFYRAWVIKPRKRIQAMRTHARTQMKKSLCFSPLRFSSLVTIFAPSFLKVYKRTLREGLREGEGNRFSPLEAQ
jgi:hypothetical protein